MPLYIAKSTQTLLLLNAPKNWALVLALYLNGKYYFVKMKDTFQLSAQVIINPKNRKKSPVSSATFAMRKMPFRGKNPAGGLCPLDVCLQLRFPARRIVCCRSIRRTDKNLLRCRRQTKTAGRTSFLRTIYLSACTRRIHALYIYMFFLLSMYLRVAPS